MTRRSIQQLNKIKLAESRLTAICYHVPKERNLKVDCICDCGKQVVVYIQNFLKKTKSCGCIRKTGDLNILGVEYFKKYSKGLMQCYYNMMSRCYSLKNKNYHNYGGRGVRVCDEWINGFSLFIKWCLDNGYKDGLHLDKDIKGNGLLYSPETCSFVTHKENNNNRRGNVRFDYMGKNLTVSQIAEIANVHPRIVYHRLSRGWSIEDAIVPTPMEEWKRFIKPLSIIHIPEMKTDKYKGMVLKAKSIIDEIVNL